MNYVERLVDRRFRRLAWKNTTLDTDFSYKKWKNQISQYQWVIQNAEGDVIYDTDISGYEGLMKFPAVVESLDLISNVAKSNMEPNTSIKRQKIVFTLVLKLSSIFPSEHLEQMCISKA